MANRLGTPVGGAHPPLRASEPERPRRRPRDHAWALALAQTLVAELPRAPVPKLGGGDAVDRAPADAQGAAEKPHAKSGESAPEGDALVASSSAETAPHSAEMPATLTTELTDSRLGRLTLHLERSARGVDIVINVADAHVKALIEAQRSELTEALEDSGLRVSSVEIGSTLPTGIALALSESSQSSAGVPAGPRGSLSLPKPSARRQVYIDPLAEEDRDADEEGVDLTA
jgi:hypothetical protein